MIVDRRRPVAEPISVRIPDAARLTGLSRSRVYELMKSGEIEFVKVGRSTLIPYDGLRSFIERQREPAMAPDVKNAGRGSTS